VNENVRIQFSVGLLVVAIIHAVILACVFTTLSKSTVHPAPGTSTWSPPTRIPAAPVVSRIEKLTEPQDVNLQAQGELKQQGTVVCPPGYRPTVKPVRRDAAGH
jgi:hypothetical protein